jgi:hypothetical protein
MPRETLLPWSSTCMVIHMHGPAAVLLLLLLLLLLLYR